MNITIFNFLDKFAMANEEREFSYTLYTDSIAPEIMEDYKE